MKYTKHLTYKEWMKFDWFKQEILLRKYKIILTDHKEKGRNKFIKGEYLAMNEDGEICEYKESYNFNLKGKLKAGITKLMKTDIDKTLTKVTKGIDDFSKVMDSTKGIGGKPKDLSGLFPPTKKSIMRSKL